MLQITIPGGEIYDETTQEFVYAKEQTLALEHSLISLSKWESQWCKPFFSRQEKTMEETIDYIRCMTLTRGVDPMIYTVLTESNLIQIQKYIEAPMTAWKSLKRQNGRMNRELITSDVIYYWMLTLGIPFECEKWHINRLLALIEVCNEKNEKQDPKKRMSQKELINQYAAINAANRKKFNSRG